MDERYNDHLARTDSVDESVIPGEELSVLTIVKLRNRAATIGQSRERFRSFQKIGDEFGSSRRRFVSEPTADIFQQQGGAWRPPYFPSHFVIRALTSS